MTQTVTQSSANSVSKNAGNAPSRGGLPGANRWTTFSHSVAFVLGFGVVFTLLGAAVGLMGRSLNAWMPLLQKIGAVLLVIFALVTLGVISRLSNWIKSAFDVETNAAAAALVGILDWLNGTMYTERRVTDMHEVHRGWGYATSFMLGVSFAAGWVPCIGPILASILFLASDSATVWQGTILLAVYSMGLAIPFLITGLFFNRMTPFLRRLNQHSGIVSLVTGVLLLYVAYLLWFDKLGSLTNQFAILNQWVLGIEEWFGVVTGTAGDVTSVSVLSALPIAFFAGLLSFISPCVLPLVPAYIGYLTSTAVAGTSGGQQAA